MKLELNDHACYVRFDDHEGVAAKTTKVTPEALVDWADSVTPIGVEFLLPATGVTFDQLQALFLAAPYLSFAAAEMHVAFARVWERAACAALLEEAGRHAAANDLRQQYGLPRGADAAAVFLSPDVLTAREREVLTLAAQGLTAPQIAEKIGSSPRTVENQIMFGRHKVGLPKGRTDLARWAHEYGLI